jgi:hypothetical protein
VVLATQTPLTRVLPAPHAATTFVTMLSGCWIVARGIACVDDDARARTKATLIILIMTANSIGSITLITLQPDRAAVVGQRRTQLGGGWGSGCAFERSFVIRSDRIVVAMLRALTVDVEKSFEKYISSESQQN